MDDPPVDPFVAAAALDSSFCVNAQRLVAGFDAMSLPDASVTQHTQTSANDLLSSRAQVEGNVLQVQAALVAYESPSAVAGASLSRAIACKMRTAEAIQSLLGLQANKPIQTCRAAHEEGMSWALSQLSEEERTRYETSGKKLTFAADIANSEGTQWYASAPMLTFDGTDFVLAASGLISPGVGNFDDGAQGAVYCKLWTPAQMLYWLLVRAYDADPLASEPKAPEPDPEACTPAAIHTGSCAFLFPVANLHFCEDYTGSVWTEDTAQAKCTMRGGTYASQPCSERKAETDLFDGDGVFKGRCVLKCGTPDEYVWNTYSGPANGMGCGTGTWIPATQ